MPRLRGLLILAAATALAALAFTGCGKLKGMTAPDLAPHTTIFIEGPVDTVNHIVHLHWFGSDPHGYVVGYEVRLLNPAAPADTNWQFTTHTDSVLTVLTPAGFTSAVFEVRAINDRGTRDPNPAQQRFNFNNQPPVVKLLTKPNSADHSDTTFASATVTWSVTDVDGDANKVTCRVWLDGNAGSPLLAPGTSFTMPSAQFLQGGAYLSGKRTLYIQGVDDGGMAGSIDSVSWYVRAPVTGTRARLLLVDDVVNTVGYKTRVDTLYTNTIARAGLTGGVQPGQWSVLRLQFNQPFRSAKDMEQTFKQFEAVVWYRGEQVNLPIALMNYGDGVGAYVDGGGKLFLESLNLVASWSSPGPFSNDFLSRYLNSDGVFNYVQPPDSMASWSVSLVDSLVIHCPTLADSMLNLRNLGGLRAFKTRDASQILMLAGAHNLTQDNPIPFALALDVPQANGGRFIIDSYPMLSGTVSSPEFPQRASIVLLKIFGLLGLTSP